MESVQELAPVTGVSRACRALGVARSTLYRSIRPASEPEPLRPRPKPDRALSEPERQEVLAQLHSERFVDRSPGEVHATLLDEGRFLCSVRTMYRILAAAQEVRERRNQARHPQYSKPVLLATRPNQVWSWDITKLLGPEKWTYFYLYVILDIFSRYVVGWMVASRESETLAKRLIEETCAKQNIQRDQLTLHADRGSSMASKCVAMLLADLGVTKTHSRPHVSNDNCYSESRFKTLKYCPAFPKRFGSMEGARLFCREFFAWYNTDHRHSGIAWLTPETVHLGRGEAVLTARQQVLAEAYREHPERFVRGTPVVSALPEAVWINPPDPQNAQQQLLTNFQTELSHCT
jgi:putative transposase